VNDDFERALRASLAENARHAPRGDDVAERILAAADHPRSASEPHRVRPSRWRGWTLPAVAAASVAAVVATIVGVAQLHGTSAHPANPSTPGVTTAPQTSAPDSSPAPSEQSTSASPTSTATTAQAPAGGPVPKAFEVADLTFVSTVDGFALGTGQCFNDPAQRCAAVLRTHDGGRHWASIPNPPANVAIGGACAQPCVEHIRFANESTGYAYGPDALFLTVDGGSHWSRLDGGALALESLGGNVIRVSGDGCSPPGCTYRISTAPTGSTQWQAADVGAASTTGDSVVLGRTGHAAYVEILQNPAGGAGSEQPTLLASSDDGHSFTDRGNPCPQDPGQTGEVDSTLMATADDGSLTLLCKPRLADSTAGQFTVTSTDGGATFRPAGRHALGDAPVSALGAASASVLLASSDDTYRSADGGKTWRRPGAQSGSSPGVVSWIGFETSTVGRAVSMDGRAIWTTADAGSTWTAVNFS
jgi:photosystem II stability/assembly factor-like uncharacterized protein